MTMKQAPINHRWQLGDLMNARGLTGRGVEVGTHRAEYAADLLRVWKGSLTCVDPWACPPGYEPQVPLLSGGGQDREDDRKAALRKLGEFIRSGRASTFRGTSAEAVGLFADGSLDFVYLDGDHRPMEVDRDLHMWWPKVRRGGILAGHDFLCPGEGDSSPDAWGGCIQPVVLAFAEANRLDIRLVIESDGHPWTFYMEKP